MESSDKLEKLTTICKELCVEPHCIRQAERTNRIQLTRIDGICYSTRKQVLDYIESKYNRKLRRVDNELVYSDSNYVGPKDIQEKYGVGIGYVYYALYCHRLPYKMVGSHYLIPAEEAEKFALEKKKSIEKRQKKAKRKVSKMIPFPAH